MLINIHNLWWCCHELPWNLIWKLMSIYSSSLVMLSRAQPEPNTTTVNAICNPNTAQPNLRIDWAILTVICNLICSHLQHTYSGHLINLRRVRTRISFSFATIFANLIFLCAIFFNFEPDFEPNFGHFSPKNYLVRKKVFIYWFL